MSFYFTRTIHQKGGVVKSQWCGRNKENVYQQYASSLKKEKSLGKESRRSRTVYQTFWLVMIFISWISILRSHIENKKHSVNKNENIITRDKYVRM